MSCKPRFICHFGRLSGPSRLVGCIFSHRGTPGLRVGPSEGRGRTRLHVSCSLQVTLAVISAADAMVGKYSLHVNEFKAGIFFLLFNPWCAGNSGVQLCCGVCLPPPLADLTDTARSAHACPRCRVPELMFALRALSDSLTGMTQAQLLHA